MKSFLLTILFAYHKCRKMSLRGALAYEAIQKRAFIWANNKDRIYTGLRTLSASKDKTGLRMPFALKTGKWFLRTIKDRYNSFMPQALRKLVQFYESKLTLF